MASRTEGAGAAAPAKRGYVKFTAKLARAICERVAAGEHLTVICADADMPNHHSVHRWARDNPRFAKIFHRAKAFAARTDGLGPTTSYCEVVAHEICVRISEGETLTSITNDPAMPAMWTVMHWQRRSAQFAEALAMARHAAAERMADLGWKMALEATPETAILTSVRLAQLRWSAAIKSPRTHGRMKPAEAPAPPEVEVVVFRHFSVEQNLETGEIRQVTFTPDPDGTLPVRTWVGPWLSALDPEAGTRNIKHELYPAPAAAVGDGGDAARWR